MALSVITLQSLTSLCTDISLFFKKYGSVIHAYGTQHPRIRIGVIILVVALLAFAFFHKGTPAPQPQEANTHKQVHIASIANLTNAEENLSLVGEVRAESQAELRTLSPGSVTNIYAQAGSTVPAGTVLVAFESASEQATVLQAEGAYLGARAQYEKAKAGARSEDALGAKVSAVSAQTSLATAYTGARSAYAQALSLAQDAIFSRTDTFFKNPYTTMPRLMLHDATNSESTAAEYERVAIGTLLNQWKKRTDAGVVDTDLEQALTEAQTILARIQTYTNTIGTLVAKQKEVSDFSGLDKAGETGTALSARTNVDSARALLVQAQGNITNAKNGSALAYLSEKKVLSGDRPEDLTSAEAVLIQAQGALASARAQLEKKRIRSPIAGVVTTLSVGQGDYVPAYSVVAVVANPRALTIETHVSETVLARIAVGMPVRVGEQAMGTITSVAPGLDPSTKKARVTISVPEKTNLVEGSFVSIALVGEDATSTPQKTASSYKGFAIPITAIKVLPSGLALLTVSASSTLTAYPIPEGTIVGDRMLLQTGVSPDLMVVTDARGLAEGDTVDIAQ